VLQAVNDLLVEVTDADMALVETLGRDFGEHSLPAIVSTVLALRQLDDTDVLSSLVGLDAATVNSVTEQHSFGGIDDDFPPLFLHIAQTIHASNGQIHVAAKRRRYDDGDDVNNFASTSLAASQLQQNQLWNSVADYHELQRHQFMK